MNNKILILSSALFLAFAFSSCEKAVLDESDINPKEATQGKQRVSLTLAEETSPMLGAPRVPLGDQIVYGINVYSKKEGVAEYSKYAYGVFTDPSKAILELPEGRVYKFECVAIQDDEDLLYHKGTLYKAPFLHSDAKKATEASNTFVSSTSENLVDLKEPDINIMGQEAAVKVPNVYKYYSVIEGYNPSSEQNPQLELKKMVYGLHFKITPPKEGNLKITYNMNEEITVKAQDEAYDHSFVYPFSYLDQAIADDYSATLTLHLTWTKADGNIFKDEKKVTIKRNVMYNIAIDASGPEPRQFTITLENKEMQQENIEWHFQTK